jgi:hypothetical protein
VGVLLFALTTLRLASYGRTFTAFAALEDRLAG